jgi:hypothetical protein
LPAAARNFHLYTTDEDVMKFNRKLAGLPEIPEYIPHARERSQEEVEELEELKKYQTRRRDRNDDRKRFLGKGGDGFVHEKYAGSKWNRPRSPPPKETKRERRGLSEVIMGLDNDDDEFRWGLPQDTCARRGSIETADDSNRYAGSKWDQTRPPRPQYRPRRDSNEAVVGFGGETHQFALVGKSGRHRAEKETGYFVPPARHTKHLEKEEDPVKGIRSKVVRFSEDVDIRVIDG